eukprot:768411-Hanusia_phi.AAC.5
MAQLFSIASAMLFAPWSVMPQAGDDILMFQFLLSSSCSSHPLLGLLLSLLHHHPFLTCLPCASRAAAISTIPSSLMSLALQQSNIVTRNDASKEEELVEVQEEERSRNSLYLRGGVC